MSAYILIHLVEDAMETSEMMKVAFLESRQWEQHRSVSGFPSSRAA